MATGLFAKALTAFLGAEIDLVNDRIVVARVSLDAYTPDLANDEYLDTVPAAPGWTRPLPGPEPCWAC